MGSSRFVKEASNQAAVAKIKSLTTKPVVSVGRFTSPDTMLSQIKNGVQDFIGAARPSIADPSLPIKIDQGRIDDIRECIGCNICYAHDMLGSGPAGLEAACTLGQRGYSVILAEAETELGGRISSESRLPGLAEWARVRDWRLGQIAKSSNIEVYPDNRLDALSVLELGMQHVIVTTGAKWRTDGVGRWCSTVFEGWDLPNVISVDKILNGHLPDASVVIFDDDHYYMASAIALKLRAEGIDATLVTPQGRAAGWSYYTDEQHMTVKAMCNAGIEIVTDRGLNYFQHNRIGLECVFSGSKSEIAAAYLIPVTARIPSADLWLEIESRAEEFHANGGISMQRIGDCLAPGIIASAVYAGHKAARELGVDKRHQVEIKRDRVVVGSRIKIQ